MGMVVLGRGVAVVRRARDVVERRRIVEFD
jgi:hypothetical protein